MAEIGPLVAALNAIRATIAYGFDLKAASEEAFNTAETLHIVQRDLNGFKDIAAERWESLSDNMQSRVLQVISDVNEVILKMAKPVSASWRSIDKHGTVTFDRRIQWTLADKSTALRYKDRLIVTHNSLLALQNQIVYVNSQRNETKLIMSTVSTNSKSEQDYEINLSKKVLQDQSFWAEFSSDSTSLSSLPTSALDGAEKEDSETRAPDGLQRSATNLSPAQASRKRRNLRSHDKSPEQVNNKKARHERGTFAEATLWQEIEQRAKDDAVRRKSPLEDRSEIETSEIWHEIRNRSQEDMERRKQM